MQEEIKELREKNKDLLDRQAAIAEVNKDGDNAQQLPFDHVCGADGFNFS